MRDYWLDEWNFDHTIVLKVLECDDVLGVGLRREMAVHKTGLSDGHLIVSDVCHANMNNVIMNGQIEVVYGEYY